jgi:hypothetical protein
VVGGRNFADSGEGNLIRARGGVPGNESPGSDPCKECAEGLIRAVKKKGGARYA